MYYYFFYNFWNYLHKKNILKTNNNKININSLKLFHSIVSSGITSIYIYNPQSWLSINYLEDIIFHFSNSYFLWDTYNLLERDKKEYFLIYHHMATIMLLFVFYMNSNCNSLIELYNIAELSNINMYISYHLIKSDYSYKHIMVSNIFQLLSYTYCRIYLLSIMTINYFNDYHLFISLSLLIVYFLGFLWCYCLAKNLYYDIKYLL